jgi:sorbitol-specific phosphotransferase system component IIA
VKVKAMKALALSRNDDETLGEVPRRDLVCTVVIPRSGTPLSGKLADKDIVTFTSGAAKDLASVIKACGEPAHTETWTREGACLGLSGETYWWGRVGLAADASGEISHVLIRAYPGDKR